MSAKPSLLARTRSRQLAILTLVAVPALLAVAFFAIWQTAQLDGDSPCYLQWCPKRTSVYPSFLDLVGLRLLLPVQLALFAAAASWLAWYSLRLFDSLPLSVALTLGTVANPYLWQLQASVMSEALTTPLLVILLGCTLGYAAERRTLLLAVASFCAGLAAAARPSLLPVVAIPFLAGVLLEGSAKAKLRLAGLCLVAWLAPIAVDRLYTHAVLGERMTSLAGRHMFAKAAMIDAPSLDQSSMAPVDRRLADVLERDFAPVRQTLKPLHGNVRDVVRLNYEVCIQYACGDAATRDLRLPRHVLDDGLFRVGLARIERNPLGYLSLAWDNYRGLWLLHPRKHPDLAGEYNAYLRAASSLPFQQYLGEEAQPVPKSEQHELYRLNRAVFAAIGLALPVLLAVLALALLRRKSPLLAVALAAAVGLEAVLVFAALFGVGIPRYVMGMWPVVVLPFVLAAYETFARPLARTGLQAK